MDAFDGAGAGAGTGAVVGVPNEYGFLVVEPESVAGVGLLVFKFVCEAGEVVESESADDLEEFSLSGVLVAGVFDDGFEEDTF